MARTGVSMAHPFVIFPWHRPFLPDLLHYVCEISQHAPGKSVIIIPHNRPRRYLLDILEKNPHIGRPALLPRIMTVSEMLKYFSDQQHMPQREALLLDSVHILYTCVQNLAQQGQYTEIAEYFSRMDLGQFLPWGTRLCSLFEEYMNQLLPVQDIAYVEGDVSAKAAALLGALSQIYADYTAELMRQELTTQGLTTLLTAQHIQNKGVDYIPPPLLSPHQDDNIHIFIAGLTALTQGEHVLIKSLWHKGAHICLHTDPHTAHVDTRAQSHAACTDHTRWIETWQAPCFIPDFCKDTPVHGQNQEQNQKISFFAGYDVHSQLLAVQENLENTHTTQSANTAIVLTSPDLLMPTLHHLPRQDFNVSMGYPLNKSSLFGLIENILHMHTKARAPLTEETSPENYPQRYHWRSVLQCLRHPYIRMLAIHENSLENIEQNTSLQNISLMPILFHMERILREGKRFVQPHTLLKETLKEAALEKTPCFAAQKALLEKLFHCLFHNFCATKSTASMAQALFALGNLLLEHAHSLLERSPLDAESLFRLMQHVLPALTIPSMAQEILPQNILFALSRELMAKERVPFEAYPLTGLQVLGMLETRLLHFERVLIVDATDDTLPGFSAEDPLLPDALRQLMGLPSAEQRERVFAHTLYRLLASAKEIQFFWQEGSQSSALFDGKKSRSRFVDDYIWQEEQKKGRIIENGETPLHTASCPVSPIQQEPVSLLTNKALQQKIHNLLHKGISPSKIDTYLRCPQRFAWEHVYNLRPLQEVNEGHDPAKVGTLIHNTLHKLYTPSLGQDVYKENIHKAHVQACWDSCFNDEELKEFLPPDSLMMLKLAGPHRLMLFIQNQPEMTHILDLEKEIAAPLIIEKSTHNPQRHIFMIKGRLDRVDKRWINDQKSIVILDYKTGKIERPSLAVWENEELWQNIQLWTPESANSSATLEDVATAFTSLQLPCYIYLCKEYYTQKVADAALVDLAEKGKEIFLLGADMEESMRDTIINTRIEQVLSFVLDHMHSATSFMPRQGEHCQFCPYTTLCHK